MMNIAGLDSMKTFLYLDMDLSHELKELLTDDLRAVFCGGYLCALKTLEISDPEVEEAPFGSNRQFYRVMSMVRRENPECLGLRSYSTATPEQRKRSRMFEELENFYRDRYEGSSDCPECFSEQQKEERREELLSNSRRPIYDVYDVHMAFVLGHQLARYMHGDRKEFPALMHNAFYHSMTFFYDNGASDAVEAELQRILQEMAE